MNYIAIYCDKTAESVAGTPYIQLNFENDINFARFVTCDVVDGTALNDIPNLPIVNYASPINGVKNVNIKNNLIRFEFNSNPSNKTAVLIKYEPAVRKKIDVSKFTFSALNVKINNVVIVNDFGATIVNLEEKING